MNDQTEFLKIEKKVEFYIQLGKWLIDEGNSEQGERAYRTAVAIAKREIGEGSGTAGRALFELWFFYDGEARTEEAEQTWRELIEIIRIRYKELIDPSYG